MVNQYFFDLNQCLQLRQEQTDGVTLLEKSSPIESFLIEFNNLSFNCWIAFAILIQ